MFSLIFLKILIFHDIYMLVKIFIPSIREKQKTLKFLEKI